MASETNDNQVSAAFDYILNELPKSCFSLVKEMSVAADLGDYDAVSELTGRLKRADVLKNELEQMQAEWQSVFDPESVPAKLLESPSFGGDAPIYAPGQFELCSPTLRAIRTLGGKGRMEDINQTVIKQMQLPVEITRQQLYFGYYEEGKSKVEWELDWARTILKRCGLIDNPKRGIWELTELGRSQQWLTAAEWKSLPCAAATNRRN